MPTVAELEQDRTAAPRTVQDLEAELAMPRPTTLERVGGAITSAGRAISEVPGVLPALNILSAPGEYLRGALGGKVGERVSPSEFADIWSQGGTEQVLRERGPLAATIRDLAAGFVDPLLGLGMVGGLSRGLKGVQRPVVGPSVATEAQTVKPPIIEPGATQTPTTGIPEQVLEPPPAVSAIQPSIAEVHQTVIGPQLEDLFTKNLAPVVHQKMTVAAKEYFAEHPTDFVPEMTVADNMVREYLRGNLTAPFLQAHGIAVQDFLPQFRESIRQSAQRMAYHSQVMRTINLSSEEAEALRQAGFAVDDTTIIRPLWKQLDDVRRGLLVTQLSTAMRNAETQVARVGLDVLQAPLDAGLQRLAGVPKTVSPLDGLEEMLSIFRTGTKANVTRILDKFPAQKDRLLMNYSSDLQRPAGVAGPMKYAEQAVDVLNWANRFQEYLVRRGVFQAKLSQELRGRNMDLNQLIQSNAIGVIPKDAIEAATTHALEVTFAKMPQHGTAAKAFVDVINKMPGATLPVPFPRFMVNSLKFIWDYNPTGILNYLSSAERKAFAAGDVSAISKATLGSALLLTAYQLRRSEFAGEKWYEVKGPGGTTIDLRPFNPFAAHLFMADVAKRAHDGTLDTFTGKDIAMGILSTNMRAGVGLYVLDKTLEGLTSYGDSEGALRGIKELAGQTVAGVLTPLRQVIDLLGEFDQEHRKLRDVRQEPFAGPIKSAIPGVVTTLPEAATPTRTGPPERVHPLARQLTGMAMSEKTPVEHELDRLGFTRRQILPSTGDPAIDRVRALTMGPSMEQGARRLILSPSYLDLTDVEKGYVLEAVIQRLRNPANVAGLAAMSPDQIIQERLKQLPTRKRRLLQEQLTK